MRPVGSALGIFRSPDPDLWVLGMQDSVYPRSLSYHDLMQNHLS